MCIIYTLQAQKSTADGKKRFLPETVVGISISSQCLWNATKRFGNTKSCFDLG
jgi:hypothetical protein